MLVSLALAFIPFAAAQTCVASLGQLCSLLSNATIYTANWHSSGFEQHRLLQAGRPLESPRYKGMS
jgi:hypothetical protein